MKDHFSSRNADWSPALILYAWTNSASCKRLNGQGQPLRDPTKGSPQLREQAEYLGRFVLLQLLRVLTVAGAPLSRAFEAAVWLRSGMMAIALEFKRVIAAFIGFQYQRIPGSSVLALNWDFLPAFRRWHISLGVFSVVQ
jgi:hypothetical protein